MIVEIVVPQLGESITEVEVGSWLKLVGDPVDRDEPVVEVESEKATVEVPAPQAGVLTSIKVQPGETAQVGDVLGEIDTEAAVDVPAEDTADAQPAKAPEPEVRSAAERLQVIMPSAARVLGEEGIPIESVKGTGPGGRVLKEDALGAVASAAKTAPKVVAPTPPSPTPTPVAASGDRERRVRMSPMRRTIAARLVEAKTNAALLTTFNEIDMLQAKRLRKEHGEAFLEAHGVKLGFMSLFVKAAVAALKDYPEINAEVQGEEIVYRDRYDVGIAVGGGKGLVVPVIRGADEIGLAEIERRIGDFGARAKTGALSMDELEGGTFTISNGGVFGSLLSTPIVNPPQSGILGLHAINDRPVVVDGQIVVRPMMYVALTYDHRIVDGREAVSFLKSIKERVEAPARLLLEI